MSPAGPSSAELRRAAGQLDEIAASAQRTVSQVASFSSQLNALPRRVDAVIAGSATRIDQQMVEQLLGAGRNLEAALGALRRTQSAARQAADQARAQAARAEIEEQQQRQRSRR